MLTVVPSVDDPQRHPYRVWLCEDDIVAVVVAFDNGTSVMNCVSTTVPMPWTVAFTRPLASVCTPATYFDERMMDFIAQGAGEELLDLPPDELRVAMNKYLDKDPTSSSTEAPRTPTA